MYFHVVYGVIEEFMEVEEETGGLIFSYPKTPISSKHYGRYTLHPYYFEVAPHGGGE